MTPRRRPDELFERALLVACALATAWCVADFVRAGLAMRFAFDDWEWLGRSTRMGDLVREQLSFRWEVFRPLPQHLYALSRALFGLRTAPLAAVFVASHLAAAWGAARVARAMGFTPVAGALVAILGMLDPVAAQSFGFFSLNQPVLGRAFMLASLAALLERDAPRARDWLPWAALAIVSHEQSVLLAPLWALARMHRDGVATTLRACKARPGRDVLILCLGYVAFRFVVRDAGSSLPHALGFRAVPQKFEMVAQHVEQFVMFHLGDVRQRDGSVWRDLGVVAWVAVLASYGVRDPSRALRTAVTAALWTLGCYVPYFLAMNESAGYHFNLSLLGLALLPAAAFGDLWARCAGRASAVRALLAALFVTTVLPFGRDYLRTPPVRAADQVIDLVRPRLRGEPDGVSHLVFLDDVGRRGFGGAPRYIAAMSGEWDLNRPQPSAGGRNWALVLSFPGRHIRVWTLRGEHAPHLCLRDGDVLLRVRSDDPGDPRAFTPLPGCANPDGIPDALDLRTPAGAALAADPAWAASDAPALARAYWTAYAHGDRDGALRAGDALLARRGSFEGHAAVTLQLDAVQATMPLPYPQRAPR